jgi:hypothetical protein
MASIFGEIVDKTQITGALQALIEKWLPTYLRELETTRGLPAGCLEDIRSWRTAADQSDFPEDSLPAATIVCPGLHRPPTRESGVYVAHWSCAVGIRVSAIDPPATENLVGWYAAAIRALVLQHKSLGGLARTVEWVDEGYRGIPVDQSRTHGLGRVNFVVQVPGAVNDRMGPPDAPVATSGGVVTPPGPPTDPPTPPPVYGPWPTATTVLFDFEEEPIE